MQRHVYDDFGSGKCFLVEYQTADRRKQTQREITREQFEAARAACRRSDLTEQERSELIESILDDSEALGMILTGRKKADAAPDQENSADL